MAIAMAVLGFLSIVGWLVQIPGVDHVLETFLAGSFIGSSLFELMPSSSAEWEGLGMGGLVAVTGIGLAYLLYIARPGTTARLQERLAPVHTFLINKWYFDELYDAVLYRPLIACGRWANSTFERVVVNGIVNGTVGLVRGVGVAVRGAQSGFVRAYALLLLGGFAALGLYFLIVSS
jgi:NADH-quinone oxidoreductase subunit L